MSSREPIVPIKDSQEAFDIVWNAFVVEGKPAGHNGWDCVLCVQDRSGPPGSDIKVTDCRCAAGWLLPEPVLADVVRAHYTTSSWETVFGMIQGVHDRLKLLEPVFLNRLQSAHDQSVRYSEGTTQGQFRARIEVLLRCTAHDWGLTVPTEAPI